MDLTKKDALVHVFFEGTTYAFQRHTAFSWQALYNRADKTVPTYQDLMDMLQENSSRHTFVLATSTGKSAPALTSVLPKNNDDALIHIIVQTGMLCVWTEILAYQALIAHNRVLCSKLGTGTIETRSVAEEFVQAG